MTKRCKITALALAAAMLCGGMAQAADWINISEWSYNDVSAFVSHGLLPESFAGISDYKAKITRLQFTDLVESVIKKTKLSFSDSSSNRFEDTQPGASADFLGIYDIVEGTHSIDEERIIEDGGAYTHTDEYFSPDEEITREDAAVILQRTGKKFGGSEWVMTGGGMTEFADYDKISDYAKDAVSELRFRGIVTDVKDNCFMPKEKLTIEQAVTMIYRLYNTFYKTVSPDYENWIDTNVDTLLKTFDNGLTEHYRDHTIYVFDGDKELLELDADVYSMVSCADHDDRRLVFAVNFNDKTDVFDADTGEALYTIPYITDGIMSGYARTLSSRFAPTLYGLYCMDGTEKLAPEYSITELEALIKNNFTMPEEKFREADGYVAYVNKDDNGHLYRVDTNGENRLKLSDGSCYDTIYFMGRLYFRTEEDELLHSVRLDGTGLQTVGDVSLEFIDNKNRMFENGMGFCYYRNGSDEDDFDYQVLIDSRYVILRGADSHLYSVDITADTLVPVKLDAGAYHGDIGKDGKYLYFFEYADGGDVETALPGICRTDGKTVERLAGDYIVTDMGFVHNEGRSGVDKTQLAFTAEGKDGKYYILNTVTGEITEHEYIKPQVDEVGVHRAPRATGMSEEYLDEHYSTDDVKVYTKSDYDSGNNYFRIEHGGGGTDWICGNLVYNSGKKVLYCVVHNFPVEQKEERDLPFDVSYGARELYEYDVETGEIRKLYENYRTDASDAEFNGCFMYRDWNDIWYRYRENEDSETVYPCKGLYRYGELAALVKPDKNSGFLYKLDKDGNMFCLADVYSSEAVLIRGGDRYADIRSYH